MTTNISKKRKFIADGVFYAELNEVRRPGEVLMCMWALGRGADDGLHTITTLSEIVTLTIGAQLFDCRELVEATPL